MCSDGQTVIEKTQICDDVPDCPVNNNSYYLVAEDESHMCPGDSFSPQLCGKKKINARKLKEKVHIFT